MLPLWMLIVSVVSVSAGIFSTEQVAFSIEAAGVTVESFTEYQQERMLAGVAEVLEVEVDQCHIWHMEDIQDHMRLTLYILCEAEDEPRIESAIGQESFTYDLAEAVNLASFLANTMVIWQVQDIEIPSWISENPWAIALPIVFALLVGVVFYMRFKIDHSNKHEYAKVTVRVEAKVLEDNLDDELEFI